MRLLDDLTSWPSRNQVSQGREAEAQGDVAGARLDDRQGAAGRDDDGRGTTRHQVFLVYRPGSLAAC
jgi:hypothetical protein